MRRVAGAGTTRRCARTSRRTGGRRSTTSRGRSCGRRSASASRYRCTRRCTGLSKRGRPRGHPLTRRSRRDFIPVGGFDPIQEEGVVRRATRWGALAAILAAAAAVAALAGTTGGHAATAAQPIVIGWAFDQKGQMAPFDDPALAAAKIRVAQINAKGGAFGGRKLQIKTCDTQNNDPAKAKACAASLLGAGANIVFTTCDVDFATPVVQEAINRGVLAVAPCIGTDQMGPKRFGAKGKLAFSFGNVAQDEGSAMAEYAHRRGWKTAALATNTLL